MTEEMFDILDEHGTVMGQATRSQCHAHTFLLHGVVHVLVFNSTGDIVLQKRSFDKEIQPGKWDTSVGGHILSGESIDDALARETLEELGISGVRFEFCYRYIMVSDIERELVSTFRCTWDGPIRFQAKEIDEIRHFSGDDIERNLKSGIFTPNFVEEWGYYKNCVGKKRICKKHIILNGK